MVAKRQVIMSAKRNRKGNQPSCDVRDQRWGGKTCHDSDYDQPMCQRGRTAHDNEPTHLMYDTTHAITVRK